MAMLRSRRGALVIAFVAVMASFAVMSAVQADSTNVGVLHVSERVEVLEVPAAVLAARDARASRVASTGAAPAAPAQAPETIAFATFEEEQWPPDGWEVMGVDDAGQEVDTWTWGRATCEAYDSDASAWGSGGGTEGSNHPCWTPYSSPVDTYLMFPGIDTTTYEGGVQVQLRLKRNIPLDESFRMCVLRSGEQQASCFHTTLTGDPSQETDWLQLSDPWVFEDTGGLTDLMFFLWYVDREPDGTHKGVLVDNVLVEALPQQAPPTNTPAPTAGPTQPVPQGPTIFLPVTMKRAEIGDLAPIQTPEPSSVTGAFGIGYDASTGELTGEGTAFEYGQLLLCFRMQWTDIPVDTAMRYQWYADDQEILPDDTGLNPRWTNEQATGWNGNCIQANNPETGERIPIPLATYRVDMFVDDITPDATPVGSASAVVQEDTPPGVTPLPSPTATIDPEMYDCSEIVVNGDFEQGPNVGWSLNSNAVDQNEDPVTVDGVIIQNEAAFQGDWFAFLGRGLEIFMELFQTEEVALYEEDQLYSATLNYFAGMITEETPDGEHNDIFAPYFISQESTPDEGPDNAEQVPNSGFSEETTEAGRWHEWNFDVTDMLVKRDGWDTARLLFLSRQNDFAVTQHFLDSVTLEVCLVKDGGAPPAAQRPLSQKDGVSVLRPIADAVVAPMFEASPSASPLLDDVSEVEMAPVSAVR